MLKVHLIDGTYELFRSYFGAPEARDPSGREVGATRGLLRSFTALLGPSDVSHVAAAFDTVIESCRNQLFDGYKTGEGIAPDLFAQFPLAERATRALGIAVWSMIDFEADDALATGAKLYRDAADQIVLCSPDKDLAQCVIDARVVCLDRRRERELDYQGVIEKFGVRPESIPDWLGLVGDSADGIPGIPRWGAKSSAAVLLEYRHIDAIPDDVEQWSVKVRGAKSLAENLRAHREQATLYRQLATLREDVPLDESLDDLRWRGARRGQLEALLSELGMGNELLQRIARWRDDE
jgi:5'-3' exonuclease